MFFLTDGTDTLVEKSCGPENSKSSCSRLSACHGTRDSSRQPSAARKGKASGHYIELPEILIMDSFLRSEKALRDKKGGQDGHTRGYGASKGSTEGGLGGKGKDCNERDDLIPTA